MIEPGNEPVKRSSDYSIYTLSGESNLDGLAEFVSGLYAVGAFGDEWIRIRNYELLVKVRSDDLMPKPGKESVKLRYSKWRALQLQIVGLWIAVVVLILVCIALLVFL